MGALHRTASPQPQPVVQAETTLPAGVVEEVPTESVDPDLAAAEVVSEDAALSDEEPPPTPKQTSPKNNARINASRVYLRWTAVEDDSGDPVTYAFEIQDRLSSGSYGKTQTISGLEVDLVLGARALRHAALAGLGGRQGRQQERDERVAILQAHPQAGDHPQAERRDDVDQRTHSSVS